ncbi:hypothetical protein BOTBODRAFT_187400 [Botryobasidium botryosum FD-172 SS1]|uniref:Uncharacterized protein n=1 Tax=Botryobasidium botryosum (strain FD-172 SS1) TaxID=930990 RepID=A0A067MHP7_BOTB1|nr:hypothetical protein BOTBODRAFT_187400 [Botryobasidium botryosum FD-172 SS1]
MESSTLEAQTVDADHQSVVSATSTVVETARRVKTIKTATRRSTRVPKPPADRVIQPPKPRKKRERAAKTKANAGTTDGNVDKPAKKARTELATATIKARDSRDIARKKWLLRHQHLFEPLLPQSSVVFSNMQKELASIQSGPAYIPRHELDEQPSLVTGGVMKDYQLQGLSYLLWMHHNGMNCILGDEMGLGKTLQTLSLFAYIKEHAKGPQEPHLVICPLSVLQSWQNEAARFTPSLQTIRFHGPAPERARLKALPALRDLHGPTKATDTQALDVVITTYESYVAENMWFKTRRWNYVVLDEGHKIKNHESAIAASLIGIGSNYRLVLTGTPVQNNLIELWSLLHWLYPLIFTPPSMRLFNESFNLTQGSYKLPIITHIQKLLDVIMLRRTKANVLGADGPNSIPPREELTVFIPMSEAQRFWTYRLLTRMEKVDMKKVFGDSYVDGGLGSGTGGTVDEGRREVLQMLESQATGAGSPTPSMDGPKGVTAQQNQWKKLMNLLMQLRKVCDHPYLLPGAEPANYLIGEHVVAASSKMVAIDKILADVLPKGERVLIFSQWTGMLNLLEDFMALRHIPYARLDGSTMRPRRTLDIKLFQQEVSPYKVFLISTKAGGLGINLTKASTVIMCDSNWNPQIDLQAIARAHRIGQTKPVKVYRLICRASVEDQMLDRIRRKLFLSVKLMGSTSANPSADSSDANSSLGSSELIDILRKGSSALTSSDDEMSLAQFLDAPISEILDLSRAKETARDAKMKQELAEDASIDTQLLHAAEEEQARLLSGVAQVRSRLFEGKVVNRASNEEIKQEWEEMQKRAWVDRTVMVDGLAFVVDQPKPLDAPTHTGAIEKKKRKKFDSEDYCVYCRDGGDLVLCDWCPRVFHAECHGQPLPRIGILCSQHACCSCARRTSEAGGMLFRCQTCWRAMCEDCLPDGEIEAIGDTLPEFELLDFGASASSYYIRCADCLRLFAEEPAIWKGWQEEMRITQIKLDEKNKRS